jgi:CubicO group peptidase (beta-lactamase class C family)
MNDMITLRDMMCHRTGLPRHDLSWYLFGNSTRDSMILKIQYMEPTAGIRERWQYNNFMFAAQGVVAGTPDGQILGRQLVSEKHLPTPRHDRIRLLGHRPCKKLPTPPSAMA